MTFADGFEEEPGDLASHRLGSGRLPLQRLKQLAIGGVASVVFSAVAANIVRLGSNLILTRLLAPEAFGVTAVVISVQFTISLLSDVGFYDFIVQHKDGDDDRFRDEIWSIRLARGAALMLIMLLLAYPMSVLLKKPVFFPVLAVWSVDFLLNGLSSLAWATAVRAKQFWRLSIFEFAASVTGTIVSIICAYIFRSYWALIGGMGANALALTLYSYLMFDRSGRRWRFSRERLRELWQFSRFITAGSMLTVLVMQTDKLLLARMMPLPIFGVYSVAATLALAPTGLVLSYTSRVLLGTYADAARRDALRWVFYARRRKVALLYMAMIGLGIGGAPLIVAILYRPNFYMVTPFLQLLLISSGLRLSSNAAKWGLIAIGQTAANFYTQLLSVVWLAVGAAAAIVRHDVFLLVIAVGTSEIPNLLCSWWYLQREHLFDWKSEALELGAAFVALPCGWFVSNMMLRLFPHL